MDGNRLEKISGGWWIGSNGTYILNFGEEEKLREYDYNSVSRFKGGEYEKQADL